ncbi:hypothetical protein MHEC_31870 [Mycobacterium heckeshornense]|uniref:3'-5' exonuclease domain-containing protein n=1 Tax=Mycobacterium heckeshornense TaxID=110505 RepID=A0A7R7GVB0_9MYCO|nr:hypothetical protein MHEC_31870 [Mycobacterium heckeshornense]
MCNAAPAQRGVQAEPTPLLHPAEGVPELSATVGEIAAAAELLAGGHGPFAVDAERASGFRYSNRAYLIQIRRAGAGTVLIDPVSHGSDPAAVLRPVAEVLAGDEWILHAADQDLPCLAEVGMRPPALYDTELAGRLAGFERVNLAAMVQRLLGLSLAKGHGAADWSKRPLPAAWLNYAALDVEVLIELRAAIASVLAEQGKTRWATEEFEYLRASAVRGGAEHPPRSLATHVGHPSGPRPARTGRGSRVVDRTRPDRPAPRHRPRPRPARFGHHRRGDRRPEDGRGPDRFAGVRRAQAAPQRRDLAGGAGGGQAQPRARGRGRAAQRAAGPGAVGQAQTAGRRAAGCGPGSAGGVVAAGVGARGEPDLPPTWCDGCAGTGTADHRPTASG